MTRSAWRELNDRLRHSSEGDTLYFLEQENARKIPRASFVNRIQSRLNRIRNVGEIAMSNVSEEVSEHLRCAHCKGPVHECREVAGWWCILCGMTQTFDIRERQQQTCAEEHCSYGWDESRDKTCRRCNGTGLRLDFKGVGT